MTIGYNWHIWYIQKYEKAMEREISRYLLQPYRHQMARSRWIWWSLALFNRGPWGEEWRIREHRPWIRKPTFLNEWLVGVDVGIVTCKKSFWVWRSPSPQGNQIEELETWKYEENDRYDPGTPIWRLWLNTFSLVISHENHGKSLCFVYG